MTSQEPDWRRFEAAVADFIAAIGKGAKVTHDVMMPDVHTGFPRQRDVWIEWSILGHFPAKALVSCKHWSKTLDQKDIDHFNGEFIASGAQIGIIYSKSGFNDRAIEKSRVLRFHCCKLYDDEAAELPECLSFGLAYNFRLAFGVTVSGKTSAISFKTWREVLEMPFESRTVFDAFADAIESHQTPLDNPDERWKRAKFGSSFVMQLTPADMPPIDVELTVVDRVYKAKIEFTMLNGSYNLTSNAFLGSQTIPWVDTENEHPGPGWEEIADIPNEMPNPLLAIFMRANPKEQLLRFAELTFPGSKEGEQEL